jgi:chromate transporter
MHRIVVEEQRWISENRFLHALNYCMLLPGPEAQQLATYIGWLMNRTLGGIMAGGLFVVPGVIAIMGLSYVYAAYGSVPFIAALFFGLKAAVLAIVLEAVFRVGRRALKNNVLRALAVAAFIGIFFLRRPVSIIVPGAALIGFLGAASGADVFKIDRGHGSMAASRSSPPTLCWDEPPERARPNTARALRVSRVAHAWLVPVAVLLGLSLGSANVFSQIAVFFSKYGRGYLRARLMRCSAYVAAGGRALRLPAGRDVDGWGMAETTPGLIMVLQFVGFMAAFRDPQHAAADAGRHAWRPARHLRTFTPCFFDLSRRAVIEPPARTTRRLTARFTAITVAVVGSFQSGDLVWPTRCSGRWSACATWLDFDLPIPASVDPWALLLLAAILAILRFKVGMITTLIACTAAALALPLAGPIARNPSPERQL